MGEGPVLQKGKFSIKFSEAVSNFESAIKKVPVRKILYRTIFRGKGLEFDTYKTVEQSDDASVIDWKASLRANELLAKKYIEERDMNFYFLVDVGNSMLFGSGEKLKAEYAAEVVAALSHLILGTRDKAGLILFNDKVIKILPPSNGRTQFYIMTQFLNDSSLYGGGFDLNNVTKYLLQHVKTEHNVFFLVSDFLSFDETYQRNLLLLSTRFETVAVMVRDPFDENLPKTSLQFAIQDPHSSQQMILDPNLATQRYRESVVMQKNMIRGVFRKTRIDCIELSTDKTFVIPLVSFLKRRALVRWSS